MLTALVVALAGPAVAQDPSSQVLSPAQTQRRGAVEHFLRAHLHATDGELEEAIKEFRKAIELDAQDGELRREFAEFLKEIPVYDEAEKQARKAVELAPDSPGAHKTLGQVLLATAQDKKRVEEAAAELKRANDALPGDPSLALSYAQALMRLDRPKEALPVLERVLDRGRGSAVPLLYGEALEKSGQLDQAEELYKSLLAQEGDNRAAALSLLRTYERGRKWDKAIPLVEELFLKQQPGNLALKAQYGSLLLRARRFADAERVFTDVLKMDPGNRDALRDYAAALGETRETDKADEILKKLQVLEPDDLEIPFRRALNFLDARRIGEAEQILLDLRASLVAKKHPKEELAQVDGQLAYAAYLRKDFTSARSRLIPHLFEEDGVNEQALNLLLQIARDQEDWAEGLRLSREAFGRVAKARRPQAIRATLAEFLLRSKAAADHTEGEKLLNGLAHEDRAGAIEAADAWERLEQYGKAAKTAREALETYKEDPDLLFRLAASLERDKKIAESVTAFERLLAVRADHSAGLNYLGYLWADRKENLPRALDLIQRAVELEPSNGAYLDSLGWVYFQMNDLERAEKYLKAASALTPDDATVEEHLGDLWERRGDLERARRAWKRALTLKPEDGGKRIGEKLRRTEAVVQTAPK